MPNGIGSHCSKINLVLTSKLLNFIFFINKIDILKIRCPEVLPYEDTAIRLHPSRPNPLGYVNASPLMVSE